jgi:hypothetical protein
MSRTDSGRWAATIASSNLPLGVVKSHDKDKVFTKMLPPKQLNVDIISALFLKIMILNQKLIFLHL